MKWIIPILLFCVACSESSHQQSASISVKVVKVINQDSVRKVQLDSIVSFGMNELGLIDIQTVNDRILTDVRYATINNFMGRQLYDSISRIYLQKDVAVRLSAVQDLLDSIQPGFKLLVYDGVRPLQVQAEMWHALDSIPALERGKFVSNPSWGSVHNFGAAVDLTIADAQGNPLDMGAGYDDIREIAYPSKEQEFLKSGELSREQYENRRLLRKVMRSQQFTNIPTEWWHFNAYSRVTSSKLFLQLLSESGDAREFKVVLPDTLKVDSTAIGL